MLNAVVEPSFLSPLLVPASSHAVDEVGGVGVDGHRITLVYSLQRDAGGGYLHPQVGGVLLSAADLLGPPVPVVDNGPVASGTSGARGRSVGVDVGLLLGQGCQTPPLVAPPLNLLIALHSPGSQADERSGAA